MATSAIEHKRRDSVPSFTNFSHPPSTVTATDFSKSLEDPFSTCLFDPPVKSFQTFKMISPENHSYQPTSPSQTMKRSREDDTSNPRPVKKLATTMPSIGAGISINGEPFVQMAPLSITTKDESSYSRRGKVAWYADNIRRKRAMTSKVSKSWRDLPASARKGMPNLTGFLCYRSSLFQVLLHQPNLVNWLQLYHQPDNCISDDKSKCVSCMLRDLSKAYWQGDKPDLTAALKRVHTLFNVHGWSSDVSSGQADPEEQASWLFNRVRSELPSSVSSYVDALLYATTSATIRCQKCDRESRRDDQAERSLSVPIQPALSNGSLAKYLQKYLVEPVEGYRCEKCGSKAPKVRTHEIQHGPEILSIHLKRFTWDGRKLNTNIPIEATLDLNHHRTATNDDRLMYELSGVIKHSGSASGGHYISVTKGADGSWNEFDDARRTKSDITDARSQEKGRSPFTPYILYYTRKA